MITQTALRERHEMNHEKLAKICLEASCKVAGIDVALVMHTKNNDRVFARQVAIWAMDKVGLPKLAIQEFMGCAPDTVRYSRMIATDRMYTSPRDAKQCQDVLNLVRKSIKEPRKYKLSRDGYTSGIVCRWHSGEDVTGFLHPEVAEDLVKAGLAEWTE